MERSFKKEVEALKLGDGETFRGEGILAVTKALLQSGVSYVGGYQGAPVSHLLDVMVEAEDLLADLGVHVETCTNEASAAAMLGASINYPLRGAVTWKSVVGTNVAADALSNLASPGVIGGALIIIGEDYGEGASVIQERSYAYAPEVLDVAARPAPRSALHRARGREGLRAVGGEPRPGDAGAAHPRLPRHRRVRRERQSPRRLFRPQPHRRAAALPIRPPRASARHLRAGAPQGRRAPAGRPRLHPRAQAQRDVAGRSRRHRHHRGRRAHQLGAARAGAARARRPVRRPRASRSMSSTSVYPLVPEEVREFCAGKRAVLVVEEGNPDYIEQAVNVELRRADIQTRVLGKGPLPQAGEYTSDVAAQWPRGLPRRRAPQGPRRRRDRRAREGHAGAPAGGCRRRRRPAAAPAEFLHRLPGAAGVHRHQARAARDRADPHQRRHRLPFVRDLCAVQPRQLDPRLRHVARERGGRRSEPRKAPDRGHGRRRVLA